MERYFKSEKGKTSLKKYLESEKGQEARLRYQLSEKGKKARENQNAKAKLALQCTKWLKDNPGKTPIDFFNQLQEGKNGS